MTEKWPKLPVEEFKWGNPARLVHYRRPLGTVPFGAERLRMAADSRGVDLMPRTIESISANHQTATTLRRAGRPIWTYHVNFVGVLHEDRPFEETRDLAVSRIRQSAWFKAKDEYDDLTMLVEELADTTNVDEFNGVLDCIYDEADADRCWFRR